VKRLLGLLRAEGGQTAAEFLGVMLVVAAIVGVIAASDVDGQIADGVSDEVCRVLKDDGDCGKDDSKSARGPDQDGDGLSDREERRRGTLPGKADSDSDGLFDHEEVERRTDPRESDSDGDGLSDGREVSSGPNGGEEFDPLKADEDNDGLNDAQELAAGTPPGEADGDTDGYGGRTDGLTDREEVLRHGTDPEAIDTDGDGEGDGDEVDANTNPLVDERSLGEKVAPIGEDLLLGDLPTPAALGTALKKLPGLGSALKKVFGSSDDAAKLFKKNAEEALERKRKVEAATPPPKRPRARALAAKPGRPSVTDTRLGRALGDDYRGGPNPIGDGSALDAARHTVKTGDPVGGSTHLEKAVEMRNRYGRILRRGGLSSGDEAVARSRYEAYRDFARDHELDAMMKARGLR
jgi:hypothetical protein